MSNKKNDKYEYMNQELCGWLKNFADNEAIKYAKDESNPNKIESILDIVARNKKVSVEDKVAQYRELVGLNMLEKLEKEGGREVIASRVKLSQHDNSVMVPNKELESVKQYVQHIIKNRNGHIATPAIFEQLGDYLGLGREWLHENYEQVERIIESVKKSFRPETYELVSPTDLARNEPIKEEEEDDDSVAPEGKTGT